MHGKRIWAIGLLVVVVGGFMAGRASGTCVGACTASSCIQINNGGLPVDYKVTDSNHTVCYKVMWHDTPSFLSCMGTQNVDVTQTTNASPVCTGFGGFNTRTATECSHPMGGTPVPISCCTSCTGSSG